MTEVQKKALKDVLHMIVDKEAHDLIAEQLEKLPEAYKAIAIGMQAAIEGVAVPMVDKAIEGI